MAYNKYKDLEKRTQSSMVYKFFDKKSKISGLKENKQLAYEFHKPIIKKLKKKVYSSYRDNIWGVDLADMQ